MRELRREAGGAAEARALLNSVRTLVRLAHRRFAARARALAGIRVARRSAGRARAPVRRTESQAPARLARRASAAAGKIAGRGRRQSANRAAGHTAPAGRAGNVFRFPERRAAPLPVSIATAQNDEHELELIASWCRAELERDPGRRLLIVDAKLRQRRGLYERLLSQTLAPSEWIAPARAHRFDGVRDRRRPAAGGVPAHRARIADLAPADRAICDSTKSCAGCECRSWTPATSWPAPPSKPCLREGRKLEFTGEELADVSRTRDRRRTRRTRGAPASGAEHAGRTAPHARRVVAAPARRASTAWAGTARARCAATNSRP